MIKEKMSIKLFPISSSLKNNNNPGLWHDLTKLVWDEQNKTVTMSFLIGINFFKLIVEMLSDQTLIPYLWITTSNFEYNDYIKYIPQVNIKYLNIKNYSWGQKKVFLPECTIQFGYNTIEEINILDIEKDTEYRNFLKEKGEFEFFINNKSYSLNATDFNFYVSFDKNLFPIGFMCASYFDDNMMREAAIQCLNEQNNVDIIFKLMKKNENYSITIKNCIIDYIFKNKKAGNLLGELNNLVIYGSNNDQTKILFDMGENKSTINISLEEYILEKPPSNFVMKDQFGSILIEL